MRGAPRLSVVIVNFCQWRETAELVCQLQVSAGARAGAAEVMVVDNHSPPHPVAARLRRRPGVSLRRWGRNRGYAKAVNEGSRLSRGDWLLLLNPDMTVPADFLDGVLAVVDRLSAAEPKAGVVGFQLRNADGTRQLSAGPFPTLLGTLTGLLLPRARRKYRPAPKRRSSRVPWVTGCCFLVRRECLRQLGGLDEDYFLYYEDVDFCRRARAAGWEVSYEPALRAVHHRPLHARTVPAPLRLCTRHALLTYSAKHWPRWQFLVLAGIVQAEAWVRRRLAAWRGDAAAAGQFQALGELITDLVHGRTAAARRRVSRVMAEPRP
jgi:GT2 family glycosyltransferase